MEPQIARPCSLLLHRPIDGRVRARGSPFGASTAHVHQEYICMYESHQQATPWDGTALRSAASAVSSSHLDVPVKRRTWAPAAR